MRGHPTSRTGPAGRDPLAPAHAGADPAVIAKLRSGFVVMDDGQHLPGACLLIAHAEVEQLADLPRPARTEFVTDLGLVGEALSAACAAWDPAFWRLDYEIQGNRWRHLQAGVFPRYTWEPVDLRDGSVWRYPPERWTDQAYALGPAHERLIEAVVRELGRVLAEAY